MKFNKLLIFSAILFLCFKLKAQTSCTFLANGKSTDTLKICLGTSVTFKFSASGSTVSDFHIDFGDKTSQTFSSITDSFLYTYTKKGVFMSILTVHFTNGDSCISKTYIYIHGVKAGYIPSSFFASCYDILSFTDNSKIIDSMVADSIINWWWNWDDNTQNSTLKNPVHSFSRSDTFKVKLIIKTFLGCYDSTIKNIIALGPIPSFHLSVLNDTFVCLPFTIYVINTTRILDPTDSSDFEYVFADGNPLAYNFDSGIHYSNFKKSGVFEFYLRASQYIWDSLTQTVHYCTRTYPDTISHQKRIKITVVDCNGIIEEKKIEKVFIYPNPASSSFTIQYSSQQNGDFTIYNILGEKIYIDIWKKDETQKTIDVSKFEKRLYLLRVGNEFSKIVIQ